jgi:hypothetical protein
LLAAPMEKRMRLFWGAGEMDCIRLQQRQWWAGWIHVDFSRGGGKAQDQSSNNQPLTFFFDTQLAARVGAIVWGSLSLNCVGRLLSEEAESSSWLRWCSSRGRWSLGWLVVVVVVLMDRAFVRALCFCVTTIASGI